MDAGVAAVWIECHPHPLPWSGASDEDLGCWRPRPAKRMAQAMRIPLRGSLSAPSLPSSTTGTLASIMPMGSAGDDLG